jgi:ketosteroid isomerase-like protein
MEYAADRAAIIAAREAFLAGLNAANVDDCVAVWATEGVMMPPHHPAVYGRQAIGEYFSTLFSRGRFTFTLTSSNLTLIGDVAVERLTYSAVISMAGSNSSVEDVGKGLHVYRRQPEGSWKLVEDIWNSDQAA